VCDKRLCEKSGAIPMRKGSAQRASGRATPLRENESVACVECKAYFHSSWQDDLSVPAYVLGKPATDRTCLTSDGLRGRTYLTRHLFTEQATSNAKSTDPRKKS
jgi:hypothetical protein